jgi:protocatechuate 3,4-dioxygenase alpha subunit
MSALPTPSQTIGPFFSFGLEWMAAGDVVPPGTPGAQALTGKVTDGQGDPVPDAMIEVYQADPDGHFPPGWPGFARALTDEEGRYRLTVVKPGRVDERQAPHLEVTLFARGLLQRLATRMYFPDEDDANASDPLLASIGDPGRVSTLVARPAPSGLEFDLCLQGPDETVFVVW